MTERVADLHLHTTYSDGTDSPERIVELAEEHGISTIAISDHDNVEAYAIAEPLARQKGIELLHGIEMSASYEDIEVHILGYFYDPKHPAFVDHITTQQKRRVSRMREMVERLQKVGVKIDAEEVLKLAGNGTVGRPHVARVLMKHGYISKMSEAFTKYIGPKNPGFVTGSPTLPDTIISVIRNAGGIPVLAHPMYVKRDEIIDMMVEQGLAGLEVYHSNHTPALIKHYKKIAKRLNLLMTGGSDYHGKSKEGVPIGSVKIPYDLVDALRAWKPNG